MASVDPGLPSVPLAEDPLDTTSHRPSIAKETGQGDLEKEAYPSSPVISNEQPVAPDQFDPNYETSRWEIWAYYSYYIGNNGLTLFNFAPTAFQNLLSQAADNNGNILFAGAVRTINSVVLLCNGISFAIQVLIFLIIGSYAGKSRFNSIIAVAVHTADRCNEQTLDTPAPIS